MGTRITVKENGPYRVEGDFEIRDHEGRLLKVVEGRGISLCRCGKSATKPFCDGAHKEDGFIGEAAAVVEQAYAEES